MRVKRTRAGITSEKEKREEGRDLEKSSSSESKDGESDGGGSERGGSEGGSL